MLQDKLITPPTDEPITADELRAWLRDPADPDADLLALISAARYFIENECNIAIIAQTRRLMMDLWPMCHAALEQWEGIREGAFISGQPTAIELPRSPLASIVSIITYGADNAPTTVSPSTYYVDTHSEPGRIILNHGEAWPTPGRAGSGIEINYIAGYAAPGDVPPPLKIGIKQLAAHFYENREAVAEMTLSQCPMGVASIIRQFRVWP